nr:hypothetical protein [Tanacetum cinerariifolium]
MVLPEHSSDTKVLTMKIEILLEPTSNKLLWVFNSLVHSLRALSTLRRSGLRTVSAAAKPCQGDSSEFYLITGREANSEVSPLPKVYGLLSSCLLQYFSYKKLRDDQKCMKKVKPSSRSKAIEDIISIGSFVEALVLNDYVLVRKIFDCVFVKVTRFDLGCGVKEKSKKLGRVPTEMELILEHTQQGISYDVSVSTEGVEELKRNVKIKGVKKEALLIHLGRNRVNTYAIRNTQLLSGVEDSHHVSQ